ncbi:MAG: dTMP kinase [Pyrinomonadaceae bacterium]
MAGKFITFEGIDGSGKTTQIRRLSGELRLRGFDVILTREPGGTPLGRHLREAFLETEEQVAPLAELLLFAADRAQHVNFLINPAVAEGKIVLSDRFADATAAYQGAGRGFDKETVDKIIKLATNGLKPDITLFFDISVDTAVERAERAGDSRKNNRMDFEEKDFYRRVRDAYLEIAEKEPNRFKIIDGSQSVEAVYSDVVALITKFLDR